MGKYSSYVLFLLLAVFVAILYANGFGPLDRAQRSLNDFLCRATADDTMRPGVAIVQVDSRAQKQFGEWPWKRDLIADLVAATAAGEPRVIVANFDLSEDVDQDSAGYTGILAGQFSWIDNVVLPYDIALTTFRGEVTSNPDYLFNYSVSIDDPLGLMDENASLIARKVFLPAEKLLESKPYLGFDYVEPDDDRIVRHQPLVVNYEGYYYPSLSLIAAAAYLGIQPSEIRVFEGEQIQLGMGPAIPINEQTESFVNFPPPGAFATFSAADVLSDSFDRNRLKNRLVIIGLDRGIDREAYTTPLQEDASRLEILAASAENFINEDFLTVRNNQTGLNLIILFAIGALCAFLLPQVSLLYRFVILTVGFVLLANVEYWMFSSFRTIPETIYIAVEFLLFMIAAPMLDTSLLRGEEQEEETSSKASYKNRQDAEPASQPVTGTVTETASDQIHEPTSAIDQPNAEPVGETVPLDHQAIDIDAGLDETIVSKESGTDADRDLSFAIISGDEPIATETTPEEDLSGNIEIDDIPYETNTGPDLDSFDSQPVAAADADASGSLLAQTPTGGIPTNLGRYQISGKLGKGAMGLVYKGVDPAINRPVALKTIRLDFVNDPEEMAELKERLYREAQAAGKLSHPNIVTIYDVGSEGPLQYIAMEYLEGRTLEDMIKKKTKFNYRILSQIIIQICSALQYAHEQGIVHRDIKPANIMILKDYRVKVMDYGIARIDTSSMTKTGIAMGTPNYISPEQLKGQKSDHRADIFSLGVVMYEMLLGRRPFKGENITSLIYTIINQEPDRPSDINPQIPLLFDHVIMKALQKDPSQRYQKAHEIAVDLKDFVESFASNG